MAIMHAPLLMTALGAASGPVGLVRRQLSNSCAASARIAHGRVTRTYGNDEAQRSQMWRCCKALDPPHREETTSLKWWENIPPKENLIESDLVNCHIGKVENSDANS